MKIVWLALFAFSSLYAQYCYNDKSLGQLVCYKRYFDRDNIYQSKKEERYYTSQNGTIYAIDNKIEVRFNSIGTIISLEKDYDLQFVDKLNKETYLFEVKRSDDLFGILSILNSLTTIQKAVPSRTKKYTQRDIDIMIAQRKEREKRVAEKTKTTSKEEVGFQTGFTDIENNDKKPKNFLKGTL